MTYQSSDAKKEEFRQYLEKTNVIDGLTKVLVNLYEESEKPEKPMDFIAKCMGGPTIEEYELLKQENKELRAQIEVLKKKINS